MQLAMLCDEILFQGPIALERALFCLDCEVIFTGLTSCPSCSGGSVWPLAQWLSPAQPSLLVESRPSGNPPPSANEIPDNEIEDARAVA
jgi:hypothetical protein